MRKNADQTFDEMRHRVIGSQLTTDIGSHTHRGGAEAVYPTQAIRRDSQPNIRQALHPGEEINDPQLSIF